MSVASQSTQAVSGVSKFLRERQDHGSLPPSFHDHGDLLWMVKEERKASMMHYHAVQFFEGNECVILTLVVGIHLAPAHQGEIPHRCRHGNLLQWTNNSLTQWKVWGGALIAYLSQTCSPDPTEGAGQRGIRQMLVSWVWRCLGERPNWQCYPVASVALGRWCSCCRTQPEMKEEQMQLLLEVSHYYKHTMYLYNIHIQWHLYIIKNTLGPAIVVHNREVFSSRTLRIHWK